MIIKRKITVILTLIAALIPLNINAASNSADFLNIGVGARPAALAETFTARQGDIHSIYYNPAGLLKLREMQASFTHLSWLGQASYGSFLLAYPGPWWTAGLMINHLSVKDIKGYDELGFTTGDTHSPKDFALTGTFSMMPLEKLSAGANLKIINSSLTDDISAAAVALDLGAQYELMDGELITGMVLRNMGTKIKLGGLHSLPFQAALGASYSVREDILASTELSLSNTGLNFALGGEYTREAGPILATLRAGYTTKDSDMGGVAGLRIGFGAVWEDYTLDYAWRPGGDLGSSHLITLTASLEELKRLLPIFKVEGDN